MIDWQKIDTVFLDMDGTLLDLHFDNFFWREHVPARYAEVNSISVDEAKTTLYPIFQEVEGTMDWYCIDYWTERLDLDIALLKVEVDHLIAVHPHVIPFLDALREHNKKVVLVTNAHMKSLELKMQRTQLANHFDALVCSHDYRVPKEDTGFWELLHNTMPFSRSGTLLVDDSLPVLRAAHSYGIKNLLAINKPDSKGPKREISEFNAIADFSAIMP